MDLFVTFLGTAASTPTAARGTSATLISRGGERWLIDCGEGTQRQLLRSGIGLIDVDAIFLTHLHGDHYLGLPGILKTYALRERERPLVIVGPPGLVALFSALRQVFGRVRFDLELREVEAGLAWESEGARLEAFPTRHTVRSTGFALVESPRPGQFDVAAARALGVPEGPAFGALQRGDPVRNAAGEMVGPERVLGPPRAGRSVVLTGDTEPCPTTANAARGASLLVHEATFLEADRARARETRHSTAAEAADLGRDADVGAPRADPPLEPLRAEGDPCRGPEPLRSGDRAPRLRAGRDPLPGAGRAPRARPARPAAARPLRHGVGADW